MRLWVECAHRSARPSGAAPGSDLGNRAIRTFQTEMLFFALLVDRPEAAQGSGAGPLADKIASLLEQGLLEQGTPMDRVVERALALLPRGEHVPLAILRIEEGGQAELVECDAPPLFFARRGRLVLLPVLEEEVANRLLRRCRFTVQEGDHLAIVSEGYIQASGWDRRWGWRDIALSIKRLTDTGGDAEQLLGALIRMYGRLAPGEERDVTVVAMHVRPLRSATVWSGPPADPELDRIAVEALMSESGRRIICGGTTAEIAARVLGASLEVERRSARHWSEVPPIMHLAGVDLVTEGAVTLQVAGERIAKAQSSRDLPRSDDGATRLARMLLEADVIRFIVGGAVNPAQVEEGIPWREGSIERLVAHLKQRGKIVSEKRVSEVRVDT